MKKFRILFLQITIAIIIFCSITFTKFLLPDIYKDITELYKIYFCIETDISLVLGET